MFLYNKNSNTSCSQEEMCLSGCDAKLRIVGCRFVKCFFIVRIATHPVLRKGCVLVAAMLDSGLWAVGLSMVFV